MVLSFAFASGSGTVDPFGGKTTDGGGTTVTTCCFGSLSFRKIWSDGEFAYNATGTVDVGDLGLLLNNYGQSMSGSSIQVSGLDSQALGLLKAHGITVVPEPTMLGVMALGGLGLLRRRKRING